MHVVYKYYMHVCLQYNIQCIIKLVDLEGTYTNLNSSHGIYRLTRAITYI